MFVFVWSFFRFFWDLTQRQSIYSLLQLFDKNYGTFTPLPLLSGLQGRKFGFSDERIPLINVNVAKLLLQYGSGSIFTESLTEYLARSGTPQQILIDQKWLETLDTGIERTTARKVKIPQFQSVQVAGTNIGVSLCLRRGREFFLL